MDSRNLLYEAPLRTLVVENAYDLVARYNRNSGHSKFVMLQSREDKGGSPLPIHLANGQLQFAAHSLLMQ